MSENIKDTIKAAPADKYSKAKKAAMTALLTAAAEITPLLQKVMEKQLQRYVPNADDPKALAATLLVRAAEERLSEAKDATERATILEEAAEKITELCEE